MRDKLKGVLIATGVIAVLATGGAAIAGRHGRRRRTTASDHGQTTRGDHRAARWSRASQAALKVRPAAARCTETEARATRRATTRSR